MMLRILLAACLLATPAFARPRARDLGIPFNGTPGPLNAITDVQGVEVGHATIVAGETVRTGVSAVFPRGKGSPDPVFAGWYALNGNGEMTGTTWIEEGGFLEGAVFLTNTNSVGLVRDASIEWWLRRFPDDARDANFSLPVVAETWDGFLNDIFGFHVKKEHVFQAMDGASSSVPEGTWAAARG